MARALAAADESASPSLVVGVRREAGPLDTITIAPNKVAGSTTEIDETVGEEAGGGGGRRGAGSLASVFGKHGGGGRERQGLGKSVEGPQVCSPIEQMRSVRGQGPGTQV